MQRDPTWREKLMQQLSVECKVPAEWQDGPVKNHRRVRTDIPCCIIFLVFVLFFILASLFVFFFTSKSDI